VVALAENENHFPDLFIIAHFGDGYRGNLGTVYFF